MEVTKRRFREWMLTCEIEYGNETASSENPYLLSHVYHSNQIIAYIRDEAPNGHIFPEILLTNIHLIFNYKNHGRAEDDERVSEDYL